MIKNQRSFIDIRKKYGEGGRRFVFRRDGEGIKRNNNFKSGPISHNISHNISLLPLIRCLSISPERSHIS